MASAAQDLPVLEVRRKRRVSHRHRAESLPFSPVPINDGTEVPVAGRLPRASGEG